MREPFFTFFPQFTKERLNDLAWGEGFTDWDLIARLPAHLRPKFTPKLGFYQPEAESYVSSLKFNLKGVGGEKAGLMLYHYFFDGISALKGFENQLLRQSSDIPFFICWANESWTKRWVGRANDFIIQQRHLLDEHIIRAHTEHLCALFSLPGYRRHNGRPLFVVYEPFAVMHMRDVLKAYRTWFTLQGENPLIGACLSHPLQNSAPVSEFDFLVEFEPRYFFNASRSQLSRVVGEGLKRRAPRLFDSLATYVERLPSFKSASGRSYEYSAYLEFVRSGLIEESLQASASGLPLMRSTFLSWDNTPRYGSRPTRVSLDGISEEDLSVILSISSDEGLPLIINSWNEWSEGAAFEEGADDSSHKKEFLKKLRS